MAKTKRKKEPKVDAALAESIQAIRPLDTLGETPPWQEALWLFEEALSRKAPVRLRRRWARITAIPGRVRAFIERGRHGVSVVDAWDFYAYVAAVIARSVRIIREEGHGHPGDLDWPEWEAILREMEEGFALWANESADDEWPLLSEEKRAKQQRALKLFKRWFPHLWD